MDVNWKKCCLLGSLLLLVGTLGAVGPAGQVKPTARLGGIRTTQVAGGYVFEGLPAKLMQRIRGNGRVQITLVDPARGRTTVTGELTKISGSSFKVKTPEKLQFMRASKTWVLIKGLGNTSEPGEPPCSGCPQDEHMDDFGGGACLCWAEPKPSQH